MCNKHDYHKRDLKAARGILLALGISLLFWAAVIVWALA
jgi:hypothetical protein